MSQRRVCDACAIRRIRCNGHLPCLGCVNAELDCTRVRPRLKSGPKGIKKKTLDKLAKTKKQTQPGSCPLRPEDLRPLSNISGAPVIETPSPLQIVHDATGDNTGLEDHSTGPWPEPSYELPAVEIPECDLGPWSSTSLYPYRITVDQLTLYLDIYHHKLYPVWPIVNRESLARRLCVETPDVEAYILASSVCIATVLQLQLTAGGLKSSLLQPDLIMEEIESLRRAQDYREHPSMDSLRSSFFSHVAYLHMKKQRTSTLTLREAISMAHMLDLHKTSHYELLTSETATDHLRVIWLLFITERAHAIQYDLPCTLAVPSNLPIPHANAEPFVLSAFMSLCQMFKALAEASQDNTHTSLRLSYEQMLRLADPAEPYNQLQKADVRVTQHWTKLHLWKLAVSRIKMTTEPGGDITSVLFPLQVVGNLLSEVSELSVDSLEAHGSGMELKLFEFANTIADVMVCMPHRWTQDTRIGPREYLMHLGKVLGGFRGGNEALLPLLRSRFVELGLSLPAIPRIVDITHESSDSSPAGQKNAEDEVTPWVMDDLLLQNDHQYTTHGPFPADHVSE